LGVSPQNLFVGTALKTQAGQVFTSTKLNDVFGSAATAKQAPSDNPHQGKYKPNTDPYLNNTLLKNSTSGKAEPFPVQDDGLWLMTAKQGNNAPFHVGFLDGNQSPKVEVIQNQSEMIGFELAAGLHFGVGFGDPLLAMAFDPNNASQVS
jgi:hypothetical protein